jgi:hypothetical protein
MALIHKLLDEHGKASVLNMDYDRRVVDAASQYMAAEESEVSFLYSGWAQSGLPHKRLADDEPWHIRTDHMSLIVQPGMKSVRSGEIVHVGVPFGSRARLVLIYLQSESLRLNSKEVPLGKTLHAWLGRLGISIGGKSMAAVREQAERISRCRMTFEVHSLGKVGLLNQNILDRAMFVDNDPGAQGSLFIQTATLSDTFFEQLKKHPVPIQESAISSISNNSLAIDIYCWLAYRLHSLEKPTPITWKALHAQFGKGVADPKNFRRFFKGTLDLALAVYPEAQVDVMERGLTLNPSKPPVAPKIVSLATKRIKAGP